MLPNAVPGIECRATRPPVYRAASWPEIILACVAYPRNHIIVWNSGCRLLEMNDHSCQKTSIFFGELPGFLKVSTGSDWPKSIILIAGPPLPVQVRQLHSDFQAKSMDFRWDLRCPRKIKYGVTVVSGQLGFSKLPANPLCPQSFQYPLSNSRSTGNWTVFHKTKPDSRWTRASRIMKR